MTDRGTASVGALLTRNRAFRSLWVSRLLSFAGDSAGLIALLLYTAERFGSGLAVALLMIAGDFVPGLLSPVAGVFSDRWDRRAVMVSCELVQAAIIAAVALTLPALPLLLVLVASQACVAAVFQSASRAAVPGLVGSGDLDRANAAIGFGTNGMDSAGPLLSAALLTALSVRGLLLIDAATFLLSAGLLLTLPSLSPQPAPGSGPEPTGVAVASRTGERTGRTGDRMRDADRGLTGLAGLLGGARDGLRALWEDRALRVLTAAFCAVVLFNGVDDVALVLLARHTLHAGNSAASLIYAGAGLGLLAGFLLLARLAPRLALPLLIVAGYAVSSAGNLLTGLAFAVVAALGFQVVRGLGLAAMDVGQATLIQRVVPAALLGRTFGNVYGAVGIAAGLSYLFGGLLLDATNPRITLIVAGSGGLAAAAIAALALPSVLRDRLAPAQADRVPG